MQIKKIILFVFAITLVFNLSGCGAQAIEPTSTTEPPVSSEPATSSESVSIGEVNHSKTTLSDLTENHLAIFNVAVTGYPERIKSGTITIEQGDAEQNEYISIMVMENELPENGESLFVEWKEETGYYDQFKDIKQPEVTEPAENEPSNNNQQSSSQQSGGSQSNQTSTPSAGTSSKPSGGTSTKPQPSTDQQQQQQQEQSSGGGNSIIAPELSEEEVSGRGGVAWDNGLWDDVD